MPAMIFDDAEADVERQRGEPSCAVGRRTVGVIVAVAVIVIVAHRVVLACCLRAKVP